MRRDILYGSECGITFTTSVNALALVVWHVSGKYKAFCLLTSTVFARSHNSELAPDRHIGIPTRLRKALHVNALSEQ